MRCASAIIYACVVLGVAGRDLMIVRQGKDRVGAVQHVDQKGDVVATSDVTFAFDWPLVEMTVDHKRDDTYVVTYPDDAPGAVLFRLNAAAEVTYQWNNVSFSYFDLQYSMQQDAMYGILVTSSYGRALSNFTLLPDDIEATELFTLPYMWYVNASTFHTSTCRYFALINNFPGFENSTLDQQLVVADFSGIKNPAPVSVTPISSDSLLVQFIAFSSASDTLYAFGMSGNVASLRVLDIDSAATTKTIFQVPAMAAGPIVADDDNNEVLVFVQMEELRWDLWSVPFKGLPSRITSLTGAQYRYVAAASSL